MINKDINKAHRILWYVAERILWVIQGESAELPSNRTRRGQVRPLKEIGVTNEMNASTRSARNHFSNHVERLLGLATDLKGRILRLTKGDEEEEFSIDYRQSEEQAYDSVTAGKTSWILPKWIRQLWTLQKKMTEGKYETAYVTA